MCPWGYIFLSQGVHLLHSRNKLTLRHKNGVFLCTSSKNLKVLLKIQWMFVILISLFDLRNVRGTCSPVELLKATNMATNRWGTPGVVHHTCTCSSYLHDCMSRDSRHVITLLGFTSFCW